MSISDREWCREAVDKFLKDLVLKAAIKDYKVICECDDMDIFTGTLNVILTTNSGFIYKDIVYGGDDLDRYEDVLWVLGR